MTKKGRGRGRGRGRGPAQPAWKGIPLTSFVGNPKRRAKNAAAWSGLTIFFPFGVWASSSQGPQPSPPSPQPSGHSPPSHPTEPWYCPEPWTPEWMLQHPNPTFRQLLEDLFLSDKVFYKMSQPVPFAIRLMGWGPIQRFWQMGCPWGLPFPP